jgi:hypothetical protein
MIGEMLIFNDMTHPGAFRAHKLSEDGIHDIHVVL